MESLDVFRSILIMGSQMSSLLMRRENIGGSFIILQRQKKWITFLEIYIIKSWVCIPSFLSLAFTIILLKDLALLIPKKKIKMEYGSFQQGSIVTRRQVTVLPAITMCDNQNHETFSLPNTNFFIARIFRFSLTRVSSVVYFILFSSFFDTLFNFFEDMERAITRDLVSHILQFSVHVHKAVSFAAELDW